MGIGPNPLILLFFNYISFNFLIIYFLLFKNYSIILMESPQPASIVELMKNSIKDECKKILEKYFEERKFNKDKVFKMERNDIRRLRIIFKK